MKNYLTKNSAKEKIFAEDVLKDFESVEKKKKKRKSKYYFKKSGKFSSKNKKIHDNYDIFRKNPKMISRERNIKE